MPIKSLLLAAWLAATSATAGTLAPPPLQQLLQSAGVDSGDAAPDPGQIAASPTRDRQIPIYRALMAQPLKATYRAGLLADAYRDAVSSPHDLIALTGAVAGPALERPATLALQPIETALRAAADPLAAGIAWMAPLAPPGHPWPPALPDAASMPFPLRFELAMVLATLGRSRRYLDRAFASLPVSVTPELLRRQAVEGRLAPFEEPDFRRLLPAIERADLLAGMLDLVAAVKRLRHFVATTPRLPAVAWHIDTPLGQVVVDTTGRDNVHRLVDPLLVLDVGGNDRYDFPSRSAANRLSVLLDHGGDDGYVARSPAADPSAAILGYGILWDTEGDDHYLGTRLAQGAALFGASLLVDESGNNEYVASGHAQAHAIGGLALLLSGPGNDRFTARTHAQGSAGPEGVAVLVDKAGDDDYTLENTPLVMPSPQLPTHNTSMGQGAGRGIRADSGDGPATTGGIGMLLDLAGNDRYAAQVFAQGVGYQEGVGLLIDDGGNDRFDAAWYAMGAAAHGGAGVLLKRGIGHDRYSASHSMAIGAAHDFSVAFFLDEGGNDRYHVGDLGIGAAHDNGTALFVDAAGDDTYAVDAADCSALGVARISAWGTRREDLPNAGLFMDLGGGDTYPVACARARNGAGWRAPRTWPDLQLRSEAGAGVDGDFPLPFATRALTAAQARPQPR